MPVIMNLHLAQLLEFNSGEWVFKKDEWMGKLILDSEVSYVLDPGLGRCLGLGQIVLGERFEDVVIKAKVHHFQISMQIARKI